MLDMRVFRYPMFSLVTVLMLVLMMAMFSTMIMLPLFLQNVMMLTALSAGLVMMPGSILNGIMARSPVYCLTNLDQGCSLYLVLS